MKKTWKTFTLTVKRQAIRDMKALVAKGKSVSKARKIIGDQKHLNVTPNTIYNWERQLTGKSTQSKGLNAVPVTRVQISETLSGNGTPRPHITSVNLHVPGKGNITLDHELLTNISRLAGFIS